MNEQMYKYNYKNIYNICILNRFYYMLTLYKFHTIYVFIFLLKINIYYVGNNIYYLYL